MKIDLRIDAAPLVLRLEKGERRLAYAVVNAINNTAKRVQEAERLHVQSSFQIRRPKFFFGLPARPGGAAARIRPFANVRQGRAYAEVAVSPPPGRGLVSGRLLLSIFERGGERTPSSPGAKHVAVPITGGPARPTFASQIPKEYTWAGMRLAAYRGGKRVKRAGQRAGRRDETVFGTEGRANIPFERTSTQWKGRQRTFIAVSTMGTGGVYQRTGPKKHDISLVYLFQKPMQLKQRMHWLETAEQTANTWFGEEMEREVINAIARARGRGL